MNLPEAQSLVTLTTDFGLSDPYVAQMKGALLSINPRMTIIDVTHDIGPQDTRQATFVTQCAWPMFPVGAIHIVVVDPDVGTERRAIVLETPRGRFIGPDNGVLSASLPDEARPESIALSHLPVGLRGVSITSRRYMLEPVSATFHGRDVFAPVAAHLSLGVPLDDLGEPIDDVIAFPPLRAEPSGDGGLLGHVLHIDRFGNVITDIRLSDAPEGAFVLEVAGRRISGPGRTYQEATNLTALFGSSGYLEVALPGGNAARELVVDLEAPVVLRLGD